MRFRRLPAALAVLVVRNYRLWSLAARRCLVGAIVNRAGQMSIGSREILIAPMAAAVISGAGGSLRPAWHER
jgi:hypothetical protein